MIDGFNRLVLEVDPFDPTDLTLPESVKAQRPAWICKVTLIIGDKKYGALIGVVKAERLFDFQATFRSLMRAAEQTEARLLLPPDEPEIYSDEWYARYRADGK